MRIIGAILDDVKRLRIEPDAVLHAIRCSARGLDIGQAVVDQPVIDVAAVQPGDIGPGEVEVPTAPFTSYY